MSKPLQGAFVCLACLHTHRRDELIRIFTESGAEVSCPESMPQLLRMISHRSCSLLVADMDEVRTHAQAFFSADAPDVPVLVVVDHIADLSEALDLGADEVYHFDADERVLVHRAQALSHRCACHSGHIICRRFEEERLKHVLKNMPVLVYACDGDGSIVFFNPEFERVTGFTASEVLDNSVAMSLIAPGDNRFTAACPIDAPRAGFPGPHWAFKNKYGQDKVIAWSHMSECCPIRGWKQWAVGVDVSDYSRLEMLRREVERTVQHDLRNPINAILGFSGLLLEEQGLSPMVRDFIARIQDCSQRMVRIIKGSLSLFRIEQGEQTLRSQRVELKHLLDTIWTESRAMARTKGIEVDFSCPWNDGEGPVVLGEEPLLETLFANLVQNAVEASKKGQRVEIGVRPDASAASESSGGMVVVTIHNQGVISEAVRERFFERYVSSKPGGTGQGTFLAKRIALLHKGGCGF